MLENLNSYNFELFQTTFKYSDIYQQLAADFEEENLVWDKFFAHNKLQIDQKIKRGHTPRAQCINKFTASVFYYLLPLLKIEYDYIYDLGCGANLFKPYIPRLVGIGAEWLHIKNYYEKIKDASWPHITLPQDFDNLPSTIKSECFMIHNLPTTDDVGFYGDIYGYFDEVYVQQNALSFQAIYSICALHFCPLSQFKKIVLDFASLIKLGGRGFLALNIQRMIEKTSTQFLVQEFATPTPTLLQYDQYLRKELSTCNLEFVIIDIDLSMPWYFTDLNGNIRLVFQK